MYIVKQYVTQYTEKVIFRCHNTETGKDEVIKPGELNELICKGLVANAKVNSKGTVIINGYKKNTEMMIDNIKSKITSVSYNYIASMNENTDDNTETNVKKEYKQKISRLVSYCDMVRHYLCNGNIYNKYDIAKVINSDSKIDNLVNNGSYDISDDEKLIPVDIYLACYSTESEYIPVWTNLICFSLKYHNFIKISQVMDCAKISKDNLNNTQFKCDTGDSWVNDTTVSINNMIYYGIGWIDFESEAYKRARDTLGNEAVDTIISTVHWDNIKNTVNRIRNTYN